MGRKSSFLSGPAETTARAGSVVSSTGSTQALLQKIYCWATFLPEPLARWPGFPGCSVCAVWPLQAAGGTVPCVGPMGRGTRTQGSRTVLSILPWSLDRPLSSSHLWVPVLVCCVLALGALGQLHPDGTINDVPRDVCACHTCSLSSFSSTVSDRLF